MGIGEGPITRGTGVFVEFVGERSDENCKYINHLMKDHGMSFAHACDYHEMRSGYHYRFVSK